MHAQPESTFQLDKGVYVHFNSLDPDLGDAAGPVGVGRGEHRAVEAARQAIASPLLEVDITGATGVLFNVTGPAGLGLQELNAAARSIAEVVDPEAEIIFGTAIDPTMSEDEVKITVIATGFQGYRSTTFEVEEERDRWSSDMLDEMGLDSDDVELPAFLRRRRVSAQ